MARKQSGRDTGHSGRVNVSGAEPETPGGEVGDPVEAGVVDAKALAHALVDGEDAEGFLVDVPA